MKRVLKFHSPTGQYRCDAAVVACFDHRFHGVLRRFLARRRIVHPDLILVGGGAKSLASPEREPDRAFLVAQIEKSIRLHGTERVILMLHSDCGAYGGLQHTFGGDETAELDHHRNELRRAYEVLKGVFPALAIERYFVDFAGVRQLPSLAGSESPAPGV